MEERKEIVNRHIQKGMKSTRAAQIAGLSRSGYYYKSNGRTPGRRPTAYTLKKDGTRIENSVVVASIKKIISPDFIDYGYEKVTVELHKKQYTEGGTFITVLDTQCSAHILLYDHF